MAAKVRQLWINGTERTCNHSLLDEIRSEDGKVLAERCKACGLVVAQWGRCVGCGRERRCCYFVAARGTDGRFCTEDCYRRTAQGEKAHREERRAKRGV